MTWANFGLSIRPTSSGNLTSSNLRASRTKSSSNISNTFSLWKEYCNCLSWRVGRLSFFLGLSIFWYETCSAIVATTGAALVTISGYVGYGFSSEDESALYWISCGYYCCKQAPDFFQCSLCAFLCYFKWISMSCPSMHILLNPLKVCGMSTIERSCPYLLKPMRTSFAM